MAKKKSSSKAKASGNHWHSHKFTKAEIKDSALVCQLPFIKDTRGEPYHEDAGLYCWHVFPPVYWHQGLVVGETYADRVAAIMPQNPERIEQMLGHALNEIVRQGDTSGVATGFLRRLAHYACKGMAA